MTSRIPISVKGRILTPHKAIVSPLLGSRNVLTNEPWTFVSLWLKRRKRNEALFYWDQALQFHKASQGLPDESAPLLLYYCFMNAAKALLTSRGIRFSPYHGVGSPRNQPQSRRTSIATERVVIKADGVLPAVSNYYGETEADRTHTLRELFFNMPFIHRTFCLTYTTQRDMFLPLKNCEYLVDRARNHVFFKAELSRDWISKHALNRLPSSLRADPASGSGVIRSVSTAPCRRPKRPTPRDIDHLAALQKRLRSDIYYINGIETLWYVKARTAGPKRLARQTPTLILAAMHRLSELSRYHPLKLASLLNGQHNWLISEFIKMSALQFIDEISSEITGHQFLAPNVRPAT